MLHCPLICQPDPACFRSSLAALQRRFALSAATCPVPLPTPGLTITPELRYQSELYLPIGEIRKLFYRLYRQTLTYSPVLSSSPFHAALSWADCYVSLPPWLQLTPNPARLLELLLNNQQLLLQFICYSFLPPRFNGAGIRRYPGQLDWLQEQLLAWRSAGKTNVHILDAACGSGEGTWELVGLLIESGWKPEQVSLEGWTLDPLEVWVAQSQSLPHAPEREQRYQLRVQPLFKQGWGNRTTFKAVNLLAEHTADDRFDLILCNGLLGGPIINQPPDLRKVIAALATLLVPEGVLLAANHFHGGWGKQVPDDVISSLMNDAGLDLQPSDEGLIGFKPCTLPL